MAFAAFDDYFLDILFHLELQNGDFCNPIIPHLITNWNSLIKTGFPPLTIWLSRNGRKKLFFSSFQNNKSMP